MADFRVESAISSKFSNTRRIWNREVQRLVAGKHSQRRLYPTADSLSVRSIVTHGPQYLDLYRSSDSALSYCVRFCSNSFQLCYSMVEQTVLVLPTVLWRPTWIE